MALQITLFTDPACPFAFSAEPVRLRLRWHYGEQLRWRTRMIVLTREPGEAEKLAEGAPTLQRLHGMPIDPAPYPRPASSEPACRAVVAAREHASPATADALLRALRVRVMDGGLLDAPELIAKAARDAGLDPGVLVAWARRDDVGAALEDDARAARAPSAAARALDHKLGGPREQRRYTAPSYEFTAPGGATASVPGFTGVEAYECAVASLAPELERRPRPASVAELLAWAEHPLATAEVCAVMALDPQAARAALARVATPTAVGADFYWSAR